MHLGWSIGDTAQALNTFKSYTIPRIVNAATTPLYGLIEQVRAGTLGFSAAEVILLYLLMNISYFFSIFTNS